MNNTENTQNYGTDSRSLTETQEKDPSVFQTQDIGSKRIFEDPFLCAQFLRDYSGLEDLKNVQPEDIEKVKLRYHLFDEAELNSDSVVRVTSPGQNMKDPPLYVVPLIEHKSRVDYNVPMQLLYYMACIWRDWEKEMKNRYGFMITQTRNFWKRRTKCLSLCF